MRRLGFESLESKRLLAGDVTAQVLGNGDIHIAGDMDDNQILIELINTPEGPGVAITDIDEGDGDEVEPSVVRPSEILLFGEGGQLRINLKQGDDTAIIVAPSIGLPPLPTPSGRSAPATTTASVRPSQWPKSAHGSG